MGVAFERGNGTIGVKDTSGRIRENLASRITPSADGTVTVQLPAETAAAILEFARILDAGGGDAINPEPDPGAYGEVNAWAANLPTGDRDIADAIIEHCERTGTPLDVHQAGTVVEVIRESLAEERRITPSEDTTVPDDIYAAISAADKDRYTALMDSVQHADLDKAYDQHIDDIKDDLENVISDASALVDDVLTGPCAIDSSVSYIIDEAAYRGLLNEHRRASAIGSNANHPAEYAADLLENHYDADTNTMALRNAYHVDVAATYMTRPDGTMPFNIHVTSDTLEEVARANGDEGKKMRVLQSMMYPGGLSFDGSAPGGDPDDINEQLFAWLMLNKQHASPEMRAAITRLGSDR